MISHHPQAVLPEPAADVPPAPFKPLDQYGLIGDNRTAVLVGADGSVDWACLPDFDSASVFGALLDPEAGRFVVRPVEPFATEQYYERSTNVLVTEFMTAGGTVRMRDFMPYVVGRKSAVAEIYRRVEGVRGRVNMEIIFEPRFGYAQHRTSVERADHGAMARSEGGESMALASDVPLDVSGDTAYGRFCVEGGDDLYFVADWGANSVHPVSTYQGERRIDQVRTFWRHWVDRLGYHGRYRDQVERSLLTLKLLVYEPNGAIVAAPTTSLPEWPGGQRNWDYRFTWVRDSAFTLRALFGANFMEEGTAYFDWLLSQALSNGPLQVMYGINGELGLTEHELPLRGYLDSRPVRIGNGAAHQFQLDIYGSLLDAALHYERQGGILAITEWERLLEVTDLVARRWHEPDSGIWEARDEPRHYTYSKVWAWVALTRAAQLADRISADAPIDRWREEARQLREEVLERAWNPEVGAFTQYYGSTDLDAAVLVMPTVGFIAADDPRFLQTIEVVVRELAAGPYPLLYRYLNEDGVGGPEGAFLLPSFWLVEALALAGDARGARRALTGLLQHQSPLGLFSEEVHPETGQLLGNFPQGFSHLGLVNAIFRIEEMKRREEGWIT
jgi:alpha,alpha-trehalase